MQVLIASIMCGYSKDDWMQLAKMAEVSWSAASGLFTDNELAGMET